MQKDNVSKEADVDTFCKRKRKKKEEENIPGGRLSIIIWKRRSCNQ